MGIPAPLAEALQAWSSFYGDHQRVSVTIRFLHLAGIVIGGGTALANDRSVLRAWRAGEPERATVLAALRRSHRIVVPALALVVVTGGLMAAADIETYLASRVYWTKLTLVALTLANGAGMLAAERAVERGRPWASLAAAAIVSLALWLAVLYAGTLLTVAA